MVSESLLANIQRGWDSLWLEVYAILNDRFTTTVTVGMRPAHNTLSSRMRIKRLKKRNGSHSQSRDSAETLESSLNALLEMDSLTPEQEARWWHWKTKLKVNGLHSGSLSKCSIWTGCYQFDLLPYRSSHKHYRFERFPCRSSNAHWISATRAGTFRWRQISLASPVLLLSQADTML